MLSRYLSSKFVKAAVIVPPKSITAEPQPKSFWYFEQHLDDNGTAFGFTMFISSGCFLGRGVKQNLGAGQFAQPAVPFFKNMKSVASN